MPGLILSPDLQRRGYRVPIRFRVSQGASSDEIERERIRAAERSLVGLGKQGWEYVGSPGDFRANPDKPLAGVPVIDSSPGPIRYEHALGKHDRGNLSQWAVPDAPTLAETDWWFEMYGTFSRPAIRAEVREDDVPVITKGLPWLQR